jgi:hypothetical protein
MTHDHVTRPVTRSITGSVTDDPLYSDEAAPAPDVLGSTPFVNSVNPGVSPYEFAHTQTGRAILVLVAIKGSSDAGGGSALTMTVSYAGSNLPEVVRSSANIFGTTPTVRGYLLNNNVAQGANTVSIAFSAAQASQCVCAVAYDLDAVEAVGAEAAVSNATDQNTTALAVPPQHDGSLTVGMVAALGADTDPFTVGNGYTADETGDSAGASTSTDIGYLAQHKVGGAVFDATWTAADNHAAVALELIGEAA